MKNIVPTKITTTNKDNSINLFAPNFFKIPFANQTPTITKNPKASSKQGF